MDGETYLSAAAFERALDESNRREWERRTRLDETHARALKECADELGLPPCEIILDPEWAPSYSI